MIKYNLLIRQMQNTLYLDCDYDKYGNLVQLPTIHTSSIRIEDKQIGEVKCEELPSKFIYKSFEETNGEQKTMTYKVIKMQPLNLINNTRDVYVAYENKGTFIPVLETCTNAEEIEAQAEKLTQQYYEENQIF